MVYTRAYISRFSKNILSERFCSVITYSSLVLKKFASYIIYTILFGERIYPLPYLRYFRKNVYLLFPARDCIYLSILQRSTRWQRACHVHVVLFLLQVPNSFCEIFENISELKIFPLRTG